MIWRFLRDDAGAMMLGLLGFGFCFRRNADPIVPATSALLIEGTTDALLIEGTTDKILLEA